MGCCLLGHGIDLLEETLDLAGDSSRKGLRIALAVSRWRARNVFVFRSVYHACPSDGQEPSIDYGPQTLVLPYGMLQDEQLFSY